MVCLLKITSYYLNFTVFCQSVLENSKLLEHLRPHDYRVSLFPIHVCDTTGALVTLSAKLTEFEGNWFCCFAFGFQL